MEVPQGHNEPNKVCLLKKALYGLKPAPLRWYQKLASFLKEGLSQLKTERCIFRSNDNSVYLAIHVDDGIVMGTDLKKVKKTVT